MARENRITPQAAVIPYRDDGAICLITTSSGRKWGIPKGMVDPGLTVIEAASQECWEEAGLTGVIVPEPVGSYRYRKWGLLLEVTVFRMDVERIHDDWPEKDLRLRKWVPLAEAVRLVGNAELKRILSRCS